jgi:DNA-binding IclR family transcriptional regulator
MTAQIESTTDIGATASVTKALRLLDVFRSEGPVLGVSELARRAGVAKSTAFRLLALLEEAELVEREGRGYRLSWRLFELGNTVQHRWPSGLREIAAPWLTEVFVRSNHVVHLTVLDGSDVLFLDKVSGPKSMRIPSSVGARLPATVSASGKVMLAFGPPARVREIVESGLPRRTQFSLSEPSRLVAELQRIRQAGYACDREEATLGVVGVAAPVINGANVNAAGAVVGPAHRFDLDGCATLVRHAARRIAIDLGADAAASINPR